MVALANEVRQQVRQLLESSPAYQALPAAKRRQIAHDTACVVCAMVAEGTQQGIHVSSIDDLFGVLRERAGSAPARLARVERIDLPEFIAGLLEGTFQAIVHASTQQMEVYAELLRSLATSALAKLDDDDDD